MLLEKKSKESCGILLMAVVHDGFCFCLQRLRQRRKREKMDESEKKKRTNILIQERGHLECTAGTLEKEANHNCSNNCDEGKDDD